MASEDIRWAAIAAAAATLSDSATALAQGDRHPPLAAGEHLVGQPLALGAEADRGGAGERVESLAAVGDQSDTRLRASASNSALHRRPGEDRPHARPDRLRREGVGAIGPEDDRAAEQRVGGADDRPDVAGVADAVQVDARGTPVATRPSAVGQTAIDPRAGAERSRRRRAAPARPPRPRAPSRRRPARSAARPRPPAPPRAGPRPRSRTGPRARGACARAACGPASASRFGGSRSSVRCLRSVLSLLLGGFLTPGTKKRAVFTARPGERNVGVAARRPHPPGLAPQIGGRRRGR